MGKKKKLSKAIDLKHIPLIKFLSLCKGGNFVHSPLHSRTPERSESFRWKAVLPFYVILCFRHVRHIIQ